MKRSYVLAGLGLIGALALTSSALGGPSLNSVIKNEVAKQLSAAQVSKKGKRGPRGPAGPPGPPGANGTNGTNGTARAYAEVGPRGSGSCGVAAPPQPCLFDRDKGISSVTYQGTGSYCVVATGIDPTQEPAVLTVDYSETDNPEGNASAQNDTTCPGPGFAVRTERIPTSGSDSAVPDDNVAFDIVIP